MVMLYLILTLFQYIPFLFRELNITFENSDLEYPLIFIAPILSSHILSYSLLSSSLTFLSMSDAGSHETSPFVNLIHAHVEACQKIVEDALRDHFWNGFFLNILRTQETGATPDEA
jgi:hypothetical protein